MTPAERNAVLEEAAVCAERQNRVGREWVRDSLWDAIIRRVPDAIRKMKSPISKSIEPEFRALPDLSGPAVRGDQESIESAPLMQVQPSEALDAKRLDKFVDWYLNSKSFSEIDPYGHIRFTKREHIINWLDGGSNGIAEQQPSVAQAVADTTGEVK
jgi:hypothetical protein